ncbi:hypothetical protein P6F26_17265 [Roseibacterium sp. SDUM158017]|uniref:hypothetical protein n=1 Tax=Roseicyclus salinarum TaxID=3036773 RepID=UPI002415553F|nr:hypothetical protein [Roseibacterium sp. SDUM158017]MDG4650200.1 hypothetical protein [Roseibacterium sp. SDUM158017]
MMTVATKRFFSALFVVCSLPLGPASASDGHHAQQILQAIQYEISYVPEGQRQAVASALRDYWLHFESRVPRLSPSELAWIEGELNASGERMARALGTREYSLWTLSQIVASCLERLDQIFLSLGSETEMFHWVQLGTCLDEHQRLNQALHHAGLSNGRYDGSFNLNALDFAHDAVLQSIAPSAMADTMGWSFD